MMGLVRLPLQIVRTGAKLGLEVVRLVDRQVRGGDGDAYSAAPAASEPSEPARRPPPGTPPVSRSAAAVASARTEPPPAAPGATSGGENGAAATVPAPAPPPAGAPQPEFEERHLDTEPTEVASFGPEDDAGADVTVGAPWPGYDVMSAQDVIERLRAADDTTKAAVLLYERQGKNRKTVVGAAGG